MKKSIESIWKEGFLNNEALVAPVVNDLYNRKSTHIIDIFKRMFKKNLIIIAAASVVVLAASFYAGVPYIGGFIFLLLCTQIFVGKKEMDKLNEIDKSASSYQYLKAFDMWLKEVSAVFIRINKYFYPLFFLAFMLAMWFSRFSEPIRNKIMSDPDTVIVIGIPVYYVLPVVAFVIIFTIFSERIYKFDIKVVYGRVMNKLDELIADMEELQR